MDIMQFAHEVTARDRHEQRADPFVVLLVGALDVRHLEVTGLRPAEQVTGVGVWCLKAHSVTPCPTSATLPGFALGSIARSGPRSRTRPCNSYCSSKPDCSKRSVPAFSETVRMTSSPKPSALVAEISNRTSKCAPVADSRCSTSSNTT